jgi:hypothetical protein
VIDPPPGLLEPIKEDLLPSTGGESSERGVAPASALPPLLSLPAGEREKGRA